MFLFNIYSLYSVLNFVLFVFCLYINVISMMFLKEAIENNYKILTNFEASLIVFTNIIVFIASIKIFSMFCVCFQVALS